MAKPIIYLNFKTRPDIGNDGRVKLNYIPNGFKEADFAIIAGDGRMGVDQLFAGGNAKFEFTRLSNPEVFHLLQSVLETDGRNSIILMEIDHDGSGNIDIIGQLELSTSDNNVIDLFSCNVILGEDQAKIKKNIEANIDLFSSLDIERNVIQPIQTYEVMLLSKPVYSQSVWESPDNAETVTTGSTTESFNKIKNLTIDGIDGDLIWLEDSINILEDRYKFRVLRAETELTNVKIRIDKDLFSEAITSGIGGDSSGFIYGYIFKGRPETFQQDLNIATSSGQNPRFYSSGGLASNSSNTPVSSTDTSIYEQNIGDLQPGQEVYFLFSPQFTGNSRFRIKYGKTKLSITASSINYPTVNKVVRLIDFIKQVCKSAGLTTVSFPEAEQGGYLYNQFIVNGNLLRNIIDKPFYATFKEITEWFNELHLDYEIQNDGSIFIGTDTDFYANREIFVTEKIVFDTFKRNFNPEFAINLFEYGYDSYQSQKENDTANTYDVVHGELQDKSPNMNDKDTLEAKSPFIRDPFSLENVRVKAFKKDENSATQDDDKKYIIDIYPSSRITYQEIKNTKTDFLQQSWNQENGTMTLRNTGNFNWVLLGIKVGYYFRIASVPPQINQGFFQVTEVASNYIVMTSIGNNTHDEANNGERYTTFQYFIPVSAIAGITWTNQDFTLITGVQNPDTYGNLRFSKTRNIINRWQRHLATSILGILSNKPYFNIFYKNNPELQTTIYGVTVKENQDFVPTGALINEWLYTVSFQCTFLEYLSLMNKIRSNERGFIRTFDEDLNPLKLYVKDMRFKANAGTLGNVTLIGKGKYEPSIVNIDTNQSTVFISFNNGEYEVERLIYEIKNDYFYIKDQNGFLMYKKLTYKEITFNGVQAQNKSQLINWLNQII